MINKKSFIISGLFICLIIFTKCISVKNEVTKFDDPNVSEKKSEKNVDESVNESVQYRNRRSYLDPSLVPGWVSESLFVTDKKISDEDRGFKDDDIKIVVTSKYEDTYKSNLVELKELYLDPLFKVSVPMRKSIFALRNFQVMRRGCIQLIDHIKNVGNEERINDQKIKEDLLNIFRRYRGFIFKNLYYIEDIKALNNLFGQNVWGNQKNYDAYWNRIHNKTFVKDFFNLLRWDAGISD